MAATETSAPARTGTVEWLCSLGNRRAGTDVERRAASGLADRLRALGLAAEIESTYVHPQWPAVQMLHCVLAIAGSLLATVEPAAGFALVFVAAISLYLDLTGRAYLLRRLFFRRASQNVIAPPLGEEPADRLIICAGYDAPLTGAAYNPGSVAGFELVRRLWPARTSPQAVIFWSIALLLPPLGARMATFDPTWISVLQLPTTMILIAAAFLLGEIALSPASPGANDNASGVAAALQAAERLQAAGSANLEVHTLLVGGNQTTRQGARSFIRSHRKELPRERTWFLDISSAGSGDPRYVELEVPALAQPANPILLELCEALAEGDERRGSLKLGPTSTASLAGGFGYPAIALTARDGDRLIPERHGSPNDRPELVSDDAVASIAALAADLAGLLDRDVGRRHPARPN